MYATAAASSVTKDRKIAELYAQCQKQQEALYQEWAKYWPPKTLTIKQRNVSKGHHLMTIEDAANGLLDVKL